MSELDEEQQLEDEELQPPRSKTPSSPCPSSKVSQALPCPRALTRFGTLPRLPTPDPGPRLQVVRPLRTFLHTVQRNQMLMTPTSAPRSVMKSFIKRNTPLRVDPKVRGLCPGRALWEPGSVTEGPVCPLRYWEQCEPGRRQVWPGTVRGQLKPLWPPAALTLGHCLALDLVGSGLQPGGSAGSV